MLETVDTGAELTKDQYKSAMESLDIRLGELQRSAKAKGIPVLIVLEGWEAAGQERVLGRVLQALDPRGYTVHFTEDPIDQEQRHPPIRRFWLRLPAHGEIAIFDRSWYYEALRGEVEREWPEARVDQAQDTIAIFERQLADDGMLILKFFLHIAEDEQVKRLKKLRERHEEVLQEKQPERRMKKRYPDFLEATERILQRTSANYAPWTLVPATDRRFAVVKVAETIAVALENALARDEVPAQSEPTLTARRTSPLDRVDLTLSLRPEDYEAQIETLQDELSDLHFACRARKKSMIILYEGWDTAGKGSNIRRLVRKLDPRAYVVNPVAAPEGVERRQHYLWRFWKSTPEAGHLSIFDRSWYGRVMVERIEGFATPDEWTRAYKEINEFESQLTQFGMPIVKFWIHITKEMQLERLEARKSTPHKNWKVTDEDWRNREKWDDYWLAVSDMIEKTSTLSAPWTIVEGNDKLYARVKALTVVRDEMKKLLD